eukprot:sb/3461229/
MEILQHNLRKTEGPAYEVQLSIIDHPKTFAMITEPPRRKAIFGNLSVFPPYLASDPPRACIVTHPSLAKKCRMLLSLCSPDITTIVYENVVFCSAYWAHDILDPPPLLTSVVDWAAANNFQAVFCGDFNARHLMWDTVNNSRGNKLKDWIEDSNLTILNTLGQITRAENGSKSIIDLSLVTLGMVPWTSNWKTSSLRHGSDHFPIRFSMTPPVWDTRPQKKWRVTTTVNYEEMKKQLEHNTKKFSWAPANNTGRLNDKNRNYITCVNEAHTKSSSTCHFPDNPSKLWFTKEVRTQRNEAIDLEKESLKPNADPGIGEKLSHSQRYLHKRIGKERKSSWKSWSTSLGKRQMAKLLKKMATGKSTPGMPPIERNGSPLGKGQDCLEHIADTLIGGEDRTEPKAILKEINTIDDLIANTRLAELIVTPARLDQALKSIKNPDSAPGPDGIHWRTLIETAPISNPVLISIFKDCITLGAIPDDWCKTKGVLLQKPGRDHTDPSGYRTITLASNLYKLLEKLVLIYLATERQIFSQLHPHQYGFTPGKGCDMALTVLTEKIESAIHRREYCVVLFMDIKGAFDRVKKERMIEYLKQHGCPDQIASIFEQFLNNRIITIDIEDASISRGNLPGGAQGTSGMPLKWNVGTTPLLTTVNKREHLQALADDLASAASGEVLEDLIPRTQWILDCVVEWCDHMGLELSTSKTQFMVFTHRRKDKIPVQKLYYKGSPIEQVTSYKFLGVTFDPQLSWKAHFKRVITEAGTTEHLANRTVGATWGTGPEVQRWVWTAITSAKILYGCHITIRGVEPVKIKDKLNQLHYNASKRVLHCSRTTPKLIAGGLAGLVPLHITGKKRAVTTLAKLPAQSQKKKGTTWQSHNTFLQNEVSMATNNLPTDSCPPFFANPLYSTEIPPSGTTLNTSTPGLHIFTDGSDKKDGRVGGGWCIYKDGREIETGQCKLHPLASINQAEAKALQLAAEDALRIFLKDVSVTAVSFYSDSRAVIQRITSSPFTAHTTVALVKTLNKLGEKCPVSITWCPGHHGIEGNERADQLAKAAADTDAPPPTEHYNPVGKIKSAAKTWSLTQLPSHHTELKEKLKSTNHLIGHVFPLILGRSPTDPLPSTNVANFLANRGNLGIFLHRRKMINSPACRFCGMEVEDNSHVLCFCPALSRTRAKHYHSLSLHPNTVATCNLSKLDSFLSDCKIMDSHPDLLPAD